jgi:hypothetical protein
VNKKALVVGRPEEWESTLKDLGFSVLTLPIESITSDMLLTELEQLVTSANEGDCLMFCYSGKRG